MLEKSFRWLAFLAALLALLTLPACGSATAVICGNGVVDPGEECDGQPDCTTDCRHKLPGCGDGKVDPGEQCDDGNTQSGDGCSSTCQNEVSEACGNGTIDPGETCDDGN